MVGKILGDNKLVTLGAVATASGVALGVLWYRHYQKNKIPQQWTKIGELEGLYIYPVKSCGFVKEDSLECTEIGFRNANIRDRMFLVVNSEGRVVTGRDYPKLLKITPSVIGTILLLSAPDFSENVELDFQNLEGNTRKIRIWGTPSEGIDCGDEIASWLSRYILNEDRGLRMLFNGKGDQPAKPLAKDIIGPARLGGVALKNSDAGTFTDGASIHLISEASIKELQSRVSNHTISPLQFRPNIVVKGEKLLPFEEDNWEWVKIGDVVLRKLSPTFRCLFTTVDPYTAEKADDTEPLKTLRKYRMVRDPAMKKFGKSPAMGIYLGARSLGTININDDVYIPA